MAPERRDRRGKTANAEIAQGPLARMTGVPAGYPALLQDLKRRIRAAQVKAALSVNRELMALYWHIGKSIAERQRAEGWGKAVVERLASDLQGAFPGLEGFSARNIWHARSFYLAYASGAQELKQPVSESGGGGRAEILPQVVSQIPWFEASVQEALARITCHRDTAGVPSPTVVRSRIHTPGLGGADV